MLFQPYGSIRTGRPDFTALFPDLVNSHLHQLSGNALTTQLITDIGVVYIVDTRLNFRESDLRENLPVIVFSLDTVGKSDIFHTFSSSSLHQFLIIDRAASADKPGTAARTDNRCLSDLF